MDAGNPQRTGVERAGLAQVNTARTDAGLRAGDRTGLGDCQSKGWTRGQRGAGSTCQALSSCQSDLSEPKPCIAPATTNADHQPLPAVTTPSGRCGLYRRGQRYRSIQDTRLRVADNPLEALSLTELKEMQRDVGKAIATYEDPQQATARTKVEAFA